MELKGIPDDQMYLTVTEVARLRGTPRSTVNKQFDRGDWGPVEKAPGESKKISRQTYIKKIKQYRRTPP